MSLYFNQLEAQRPPHLGGDQWILKNLTDVTVLFGRNGSGKSALLRALLNADHNARHLTSPERAGELQFNSDFALQEVAASTRASSRQSNLSLQFRERVISRINTYLTKRGYYFEEGKVDSPIKDIAELMIKLFPDFSFKLKPENPFFELKRVSTDEVISSKDQLSSGETEMLALGLDLLTICSIWQLENQKTRLLLIDEPDTHLHPDLQQHLAGFLVELMGKYNAQIVIATHSTTLLAALGHHGGANTSAIYLNNSVQEQKAIKFESALQELATCLGGHALMGPLFGAPLILVEGDDDYKIWSQVPRHHKVKLAAIPCDGQEIHEYQKTLEKLFESMRSTSTNPAGYALIDGDATHPQSTSQNPQKHIKYLKLSCRESENLFITDEVLKKLSLDWETAKTKIKEAASSKRHGEKSDRLSSCDTWDRKNEDIKEVIGPLSEILDPTGPHWTVRVGKCIGEQKPTGQLAEFIGDSVINTFWIST